MVPQWIVVRETSGGETMIECQKGTVLCLEYEPGMFRKVVVERVWQGTLGQGVGIVGMTATFLTCAGREYGREYGSDGPYWKIRTLHPFDQAKIDATKNEKHRRSMVKWLERQDWNTYSLHHLEAVHAEAHKSERVMA